MPLFIQDSNYLDYSPQFFAKILEFSSQVLESKAFHEDTEALRIQLEDEAGGTAFRWHGVMARAAQFRFEKNNEFSLHYNIVFTALKSMQADSPLDDDGKFAILGCGESQSPEEATEKDPPFDYVRKSKICSNLEQVYRALIPEDKQVLWNNAFTRLEGKKPSISLLQSLDLVQMIADSKDVSKHNGGEGLRKIGHYGFLKWIKPYQEIINKLAEDKSEEELLVNDNYKLLNAWEELTTNGK